MPARTDTVLLGRAPAAHNMQPPLLECSRAAAIQTWWWYSRHCAAGHRCTPDYSCSRGCRAHAECSCSLIATRHTHTQQHNLRHKTPRCQQQAQFMDTSEHVLGNTGLAPSAQPHTHSYHGSHTHTPALTHVTSWSPPAAFQGRVASSWMMALPSTPPFRPSRSA